MEFLALNDSNSAEATATKTLRYRITGPHSVQRMEPLLVQYCRDMAIYLKPVTSPPITTEGSSDGLTFVWETYCEKAWKDAHNAALVLNKLHNAIIIEDKANLAFLQVLMSCPTLPTFVCRNLHEITCFYEKYLTKKDQTDGSSSTTEESDEESGLNEGKDWWVVKASKGNGGRDIWMMNRRNGLDLIRSLPGDEEYVVQKYVFRPKLWNNKKFHFRCYGLLRSDNSAYLYKIAYVLTAGMDYSCEDENSSRHISNLSVNKRFADHPGQIPCDLTNDPHVPGAFEGVACLWRECCSAAGRFMSEQRSPLHFDFYGFDVIMDTAGQCWLIELNRLPGLESSSNNKVEEDAMYNKMMRNLLDIVLDPIVGKRRGASDTSSSSSNNNNNNNNSSSNNNSNDSSNNSNDSSNNSSSASDSDSDSNSSSENGFIKVKEANPNVNCSSAALFKNIFSWKSFTTKHKNEIMFDPK